MTILKIIQRYRILAAILLLALVLRVWGIGYGLPLFTQGDEPSLVSGALRMLQYKTLVPALQPDAFRPLYYPPVIPYLLLPLIMPALLVQYLVGGYESMGQFGQQVALHLVPVWLVSRLLIALMGVATVAVVYAIGRRLFDRSAGLWAAALLATSFLHISLSHFVRHWVPATFAFSLVILAAVTVYRVPSRRWYLLGGLFAGLAFGVSYITVVGLVALFLAHCFSHGCDWRRMLLDRWLWAARGLFIGLALTFIALHPQEFFRITTGEDSTATVAKSLAGLVGEYGYHLRTLLNLEPVVLVAAGLGVLFALARRQWREVSLIIATPVVYIAVLYLFFHSEVRYIALMLPLLVVAGGYALAQIARRLPAPGVAGLAVLVLALPTLVAVSYDRLLTIPDTRQQATAWITQNVPKGSQIATWLSTFQLTPTRAAIERQRVLDASSLREADRALLDLPSSVYPQPAYDLLRVNLVRQQLPRDWLAYLDEQEYEYLVVESWPWQEGYHLPEFSDPLSARVSLGTAQPVASFNQSLPDPNGNFYLPSITLLPAFSRVESLGPTVTVYRLPAEPL